MSGFEDIRLSGFDKSRVTQGRTPLLWNVPLKLSASPPRGWAEIFESEWRSNIYNMLRRASVVGDSIVIRDCALHEVDKYHVPQLKKVIERTNALYRDYLERAEVEEAHRRQQEEMKRAALDDLERRLTEVTVRCGQCGHELRDEPHLPVEKRGACPQCGSVARRFDVLLKGHLHGSGSVSGELTVHPPKIVGVGTAVEEDEAQPVLPPLHSADPEVIRRFELFARRIVWRDLGNGVYLVEVRDESEKPIAGGIGDNKDDVILELAEDLQPPDEPEKE